MKEKSEDVGVWGFQDAAKAVREIFKIIDDLVARGGKLVGVYRRHQRRKAARALDVLRFKEGNFLPVLRKMASGDFTETDIIEINEILDRTRPDVDESIRELRGLAQFIREHIGITSALRLEDIIDGERGKDKVRDSLADLADMTIGWDWKGGSEGFVRTKRRAQDDASTVLQIIVQLNEKIIKLHEDMLRETAQRAKIARAANPKKMKKRS